MPISRRRGFVSRDKRYLARLSKLSDDELYNSAYIEFKHKGKISALLMQYLFTSNRGFIYTKAKKDATEDFRQQEDALPNNPSLNNGRYEIKKPIKEILIAIAEGKSIDGLDLIEELQKPDFKFNDPESGDLLSDALKILVTKTQLIAHSIAGKKGASVTNIQRSRRADEYAANVYEVIQKLKIKNNVKSIRATVDMLNDSDIEPLNGKEWNVTALHDLQKRWKTLGLVDERSKPK